MRFSSLQLDSAAGVLDLLLDLLGFFLVHAFLDRLGRALDEGLGFAEAQAEAPAADVETSSTPQDEPAEKTEEATEDSESAEETAEETPAEESSEEAPEEEEAAEEEEEEARRNRAWDLQFQQKNKVIDEAMARNQALFEDVMTTIDDMEAKGIPVPDCSDLDFTWKSNAGFAGIPSKTGK